MLAHFGLSGKGGAGAMTVNKRLPASLPAVFCASGLVFGVGGPVFAAEGVGDEDGGHDVVGGDGEGLVVD